MFFIHTQNYKYINIYKYINTDKYFRAKDTNAPKIKRGLKI